MTAARLLPRRDAAETADPIVQQLLPRRDARLLAKAVGLAVALHVPLFFLNLPERPHAPPRRFVEPTVTLHRLRLKPPEPASSPPPPPLRQPRTRRPFLVSSSPVEPGPVPEAAPLERVAFDHSAVEDLLAEPQAPLPPPGPLEAFAAGVVAPVLIPGCKVTPDYPELARQARREGSIALRATIRSDGSVGAVEVLGARPPGLGFEEAAIEAVLRWCYEPATQNGRPVDVYFTIYVSFRLQ